LRQRQQAKKKKQQTRHSIIRRVVQ
jgi:hypothetical protein